MNSSNCLACKTGLERNRQIARGRQCHLGDKAILEWPCLLVYSCLDLHTLLTSQILELQLISDIQLSIGRGIGFREYWCLSILPHDLLWLFAIHILLWQNSPKDLMLLSWILTRSGTEDKEKKNSITKAVASRRYLQYIEWINNKVLLCSTGNCIQYPVINHNRKNMKKHGYMYMYNWFTLLYTWN